MKRILILGAGFLQVFVIKKAKKMGYYTIVVDKDPNSLGFKYADEYEVIDIVDQNACLNFAIKNKIDGVMTAATDYGVISASYIAKSLNIPGINFETAQLIKNKHSVRKVFAQNNIDDIKQYYELESIADLKEIINDIEYPVIVKPCDGSGSKGIKRVDNKEDIYLAYEEAINSSLLNKALIEDFVEGNEYGVESFVYKNEVYVLGIMDKDMTSPPHYAELGHKIPSGLKNEDRVKEVVTNAIKSLGVNFGAINMDILITDQNHICIIDVGGRMGGNLIGSHIIPRATGYDYLGNLIKATVNDAIVLPEVTETKNIATKILDLTPGKIIKLPDFKKIEKDYEVEVFFNKSIGDTIKQYHNNLDGCGYILCTGNNLDEMNTSLENARNTIDKGITRGK